jgi:hypothetical protein
MTDTSAGTACAFAPAWKPESPCPPDPSEEPPEARATTKVYAAHPTLSEAIKEAGLVALGRAIHLPNRKRAPARA